MRLGYRLTFFYEDKDGVVQMKDRTRFPARKEDIDVCVKQFGALPVVDRDVLRTEILGHVDELVGAAKET